MSAVPQPPPLAPPAPLSSKLLLFVDCMILFSRITATVWYRGIISHSLILFSSLEVGIKKERRSSTRPVKAPSRDLPEPTKKRPGAQLRFCNTVQFVFCCCCCCCLVEPVIDTVGDQGALSQATRALRMALLQAGGRGGPAAA